MIEMTERQWLEMWAKAAPWARQALADLDRREARNVSQPNANCVAGGRR